MEFIEIQRRLQLLFDQFGGQLPPEQYEYMKELVAVGEPGVALENYSTQLFEYDVAVPSALVAEIEELGRAMGLDEKYWLMLRK